MRVQFPSLAPVIELSRGVIGSTELFDSSSLGSSPDETAIRLVNAVTANAPGLGLKG